MGCFYSKNNIKESIELAQIVIEMNEIKNININNNNNIFDIPYEGEDKII